MLNIKELMNEQETKKNTISINGEIVAELDDKTTLQILDIIKGIVANNGTIPTVSRTVEPKTEPKKLDSKKSTKKDYTPKTENTIAYEVVEHEHGYFFIRPCNATSNKYSLSKTDKALGKDQIKAIKGIKSYKESFQDSKGKTVEYDNYGYKTKDACIKAIKGLKNTFTVDERVAMYQKITPAWAK